MIYAKPCHELFIEIGGINFRTGPFENVEKHGSGKIAEMLGKIAEMLGKIAEKKNYVSHKFSKCVTKTFGMGLLS